MTSGVYKIINLKNDRMYIGSSSAIEKRWQEHRKLLKKNSHHSYKLQEDWSKYGEAAFEFLIVREIPAENLSSLIWHEKSEFLKCKDTYNVTFPTRNDDDTYKNVQKYFEEAKNASGPPFLEKIDPPQKEQSSINPIIKFFRKAHYLRLERLKEISEQDFKKKTIPGFSYVVIERKITYDASYSEYQLSYIPPDPRIKMKAPMYMDEKIPKIIDSHPERLRIINDVRLSNYNSYLYNQMSHRLLNDLLICGVEEKEALEICKHYCQIELRIKKFGPLAYIRSYPAEPLTRDLAKFIANTINARDRNDCDESVK